MSAWRPSFVVTARYTSRCISSSSQEMSSVSLGLGLGFRLKRRAAPVPRAASWPWAAVGAGAGPEPNPKPEAAAEPAEDALDRSAAAELGLLAFMEADPIRSSSTRKASAGSDSTPLPDDSMDRVRR